MTDMLVKLYDLPLNWSFIQEQAARGITIRKPIGPEKHFIENWVRSVFSDVWASEVDVATNHHPPTVFISTEAGQLTGFGCYDATALGFFGPIGVAEPYRGNGTGRALLMACLLDMKLKGYGYAIIGSVGPVEFYMQTVGAVPIPGSSPSIWKDMLHDDRV